MSLLLLLLATAAAQPVQAAPAPSSSQPEAAQPASKAPAPSTDIPVADTPAATPKSPVSEAAAAPLKPAASGDRDGVTNYPPAFFAASQPNTAYDMIGRLPGFVFDPGDTARGFAGTASNVLIDGQRPASKSDTTDSILSRIPASDVDHIELIRGGAPGIDMHGRTVMANVVRKKSDETQITLSAGDNLFLGDGHTIPGGSITFSKRIGARSFDAQLSRYSSFDDSVGDGRITTIPGPGIGGGPQTSENARTAGHGGGVGFTGSYKGPELGGTLTANMKAEETYFKQGLSYGLPPDTVVNDRNRGRDGEVGLNYDRKFGPYEWELIGLQHLERDDANERATSPGDVAFDSQTQHSGESILRTVLHYTVNPTLTVEGGGEAVYNYLDGRETYIDNGVNVPLPSNNVHVEEKRGEVFFDGTWKIIPKLTLEAGARFEYSEITESGDQSKARSFFYPKPRALLTWDPYKNTELRLRVERKLGQLNFTNFVSAVDLKTGGQVNGGNPDLRPDDHWQVEAAFEQRFWGKGSVVVTALHEEIADVFDYVPILGSTPPIDGPGNIGNGTSDQIDVEGNVPLDKLGMTGGLFKSTTIWRTSSVNDPVTHQDRRISGQRPDVIQFELDQDLPRWKSNWSLAYFKGWRETYYRLGEIDRYHIGNQFLQAEWDYKPTRDLTFVVQLADLMPFKFYRHRTVWDSVRGASPVDFEEYRAIQSQPRLYFKIRKTL